MFSLSSKHVSEVHFDYVFAMILFFVFSLMFGGAYHLEQVRKHLPVEKITYSSAIRTQFVIDQPKPVVLPKVEKVKDVAKVDKKEIVDLSKKPVMAQKEDIVEEQKPVAPKPIRRVYGLKKVFSQGLGAGGNLSDAVIGKLGNTINTDVDTFTATESDLKGVLVSTSTVTQAPRFKRSVKPKYTKEMIENKIEGVVKLKVLIDIDGKVKKATVLSDIGHESAVQALDSTKEMEFTPAMRGSEAVAVWIIIPIRFIMIS